MLHFIKEQIKYVKRNRLHLLFPNNLKLTLNNFGDYTQFTRIKESGAQESVKSWFKEYFNTYGFEANDIIQTFIIELYEMTEIESTAIKKCKNCGR